MKAGRDCAYRKSTCWITLQELAKEDNHELEGALGFPLFTDGDNRLGWLMNLNAVRAVLTSG